MKIHTTYTDFLNEAKNFPDGIAEYDGAWKSYEQDVTINVLYKLPGGDNKAWKKWVKNFEIIEVDDNGQPKWEIKLKNGDVMTAQRNNRFGQYEVELNGEQYSTAVIDNLGYDLMKLLLKPIEQYDSQIKAVDWYSSSFYKGQFDEDIAKGTLGIQKLRDKNKAFFEKSFKIH